MTTVCTPGISALPGTPGVPVGDADLCCPDANQVFDYQAGTAAAVVHVPAGAVVNHYTANAGSGGTATIQIGTGPTITLPASTAFTEYPKGLRGPVDITFAGAGLNAWQVSYWV